jgi:hypothetical protein
MKNLGERIKQAIERIDAMQQELNERLNKLERGETAMKATANDPWYTPSGDEDIADDPFDYDPDYSPLIDKDAYTM